ncbi:MAG: SDR family NAD(P)-dependent oxidoreductase [Roseibium album]|uniref:Putative oxidoreductase n=1 Tax=Roseibium album TaxID=311410 RepID=A0A0M6ZAX4_9HYPH|nr:SDR family NAD(P)-dependent oxidoreductase [Roseibium album]MBG6146404.1 NAD(P)-dependent dehydrogenase (short-subunit alcohol dehydrogenase family) [Labrenzia sp. EL_142]MBG6164930.1 NAD(P)-dependent dehydrogenase (short-subunit alcohol dehydrogenase family) [Labrenzia sp. EL_195]MBG6173379.1 NAD(P)-dependent dehydrogenase (short-subunit alcohol dehydrogenase family) [Labrenzia sp. EL_132]MBG6227851.1 NAD(P)-dependent dehydrogenase (short-subunit alcohol dehydrogenase family) [Labrenzia sp.
MTGHVLIVGAGAGLSASLARVYSSAGYTVAVAARNPDKLAELCEETGARAHACDATDNDSVKTLFETLDAEGATPDVVIYNASGRTRGPIAELDPDQVRAALDVTALGAFFVAQEAAKRMVPREAGTLLFTGASAGIKGFPQSAPFAMGKFALRGLCQSLARELHPKNIHVVHFVIDGAIHRADRGAPYSDPEKTLHPDEIARAYLEMTRQHRSIWTNEIELRPHVERF